MTTPAGSSDDPLVVRAGRWLQATPLELAGLAVLLTGALVASWAVWLSATARPSELPNGPRQVDAPEPDVGAGASVAGRNEATSGEGDGAVEASTGGPLLVHVTGAVTSAGLVVVDAGARVGDAVEAAGGLTADAAAELVNLARPLTDGEHVHVPRVGEEPPRTGDPPSAGATGPGGDAVAAGLVDLNLAPSELLQTLPGIGPARADAIVRYREANGPFSVPGDLREVPGIGETTFQRLADLVTVG